MLLRASRGGGVTAEAGVSAPPIASAIAPRCAAGTVTFWDGALLHTGLIKQASTHERLELHNMMQAPLPSAAATDSAKTKRHLNAQDYWLADRRVRDFLPQGYMQEAWDRWRGQLGELPPEVLAQHAKGESVDYAEAAVYWGEPRVAHSERYEPH